MSRILVVEDDPAILRGLTDNLAFESHEVIAATDGETGYRLIREQKPDLILLDLMLPKLNGYDLCRRVRAEGFNTPIVMLTARGQEADRVLGLDLGADDYVSKPFSVRELLARIRAILRQRRVLLRDHGDFEEEVRVASDVQKRLFPQFQPLLATLDSVGICLPARGVSGDYYDFIDLSAGKLGMVVADVAGKGVSAALLVASLHACIRTHAPLLGDRCGEVVARVNALLYEATDTERFATLFYAVYDAFYDTSEFRVSRLPPQPFKRTRYRESGGDHRRKAVAECNDLICPHRAHDPPQPARIKKILLRDFSQ